MELFHTHPSVQLTLEGSATFVIETSVVVSNDPEKETVDDGTVALENEKEPLQLEVKVEEKSACVRHVTVTVTRDDIERYFDKQFEELMPKAEVPGFRVGKAPRKLVENKFRKQVADQVKGSLLMDSLTQISDEQDFSAISEPDLDFETVKLPDEGPLTYEFDIEVRPEFDLPDWKGMTLERPEHEFSDEDVEQRIRQLGAQFSDLVPVEEPAQDDDILTISIVAKNGEEVVSSTEEQTVPLRTKLSLADAELEDFGTLLKGSKAGDKVSTKVTVSEFSENEDLQGKELDVEFSVLDVKRSETGDIDELAVKIGLESGDNLKTLIRQSLEEKLDYARRQRIRDQICQLLTESANWELPQDLLRRQSKREMDRAVIEMRRSGFSDSEIQAQENSLRRNAVQRTETLLKEHFILERIAEEENVEDDPQDYDIEIAKIAAQRNDSPRRVRARMEREGQMDTLRNMIIEQKVIDLITEHATFNETDYQPEDSTETAALNLFIAGSPDEIPEAKYDGGEQEKLPTGPGRS